jgi:hypothetical protein
MEMQLIYLSIYVGWWYASFKQNHPTMFQIRGQPITKPVEQAQFQFQIFGKIEIKFSKMD